MSKGNKNKRIKNELLSQQEARRERERSVAAAIEAILVAEGFALQPFMQYSEHGILPRVRLVEVAKEKTDGKTKSKGTTPESGDTDGATESK